MRLSCSPMSSNHAGRCAAVAIDCTASESGAMHFGWARSQAIAASSSSTLTSQRFSDFTESVHDGSSTRLTPQRPADSRYSKTTTSAPLHSARPRRPCMVARAPGQSITSSDARTRENLLVVMSVMKTSYCDDASRYATRTPLNRHARFPAKIKRCDGSPYKEGYWTGRYAPVTSANLFCPYGSTLSTTQPSTTPT